MNRNLFALPLVVLAAILITLATARPPAPRSDPADKGFSVVRASATVAAIAGAPRVVASPEHARVRAYLANALSQFGLKVEVQRSFGVSQSTRFDRAIAASPVANIIAVLPGRDRAKPAVALMAHYDSAPLSPGASDDGAGTAALIETARILTAGPKPARDVIFLITDAEELGLIGAQTFFDEHRLARRIHAVVNVEARGSRGRAVMFQTSPGNAALIDLWAKSAISPSGNSLTGAIYRLLPNDTDLSVSLAANKIGINASFIDGQFDYHAPSDTPANLDHAALQHLGDFALTTTRALAMADVLPVRGGDSAYFDLFGLHVVHYPMALGWLLLVFGAGGLWMVRGGAVSIGWGASLGGLMWTILITAVAGVACHFLGIWLYGMGRIADTERLAESASAFWIYAALCGGLVLIARPRLPSWIGAILLALALCIVTQLVLPGANWLFAWPMIAAVAVALVARRVGTNARVTQMITALAGGVMFALVFQTVQLAYVSIGTMTPAVVALIVPFAILLFGPLLLPWSEARAGLWAGGVLVGVAAGGALWLATTNGFSPRQPRPGDLFHLTDLDRGKAYWVTTSTPFELPPGVARKLPVAIFGTFKPWSVAAPTAVASPPVIAFASSSGQAVLRVSTGQAQRVLILELRPSRPLSNVRLNGKPVSLKAKQWTQIVYGAEAPVVLTLDFDAKSPGTIALRYLSETPGLPKGAPTPEGALSGLTWPSGSRVVTGSVRFSWGQ